MPSSVSAADATLTSALQTTVGTAVPDLETAITQWLFDPIVAKMVVLFICIGLVIALVRVLKGVAARRIGDNSLRYQARKFLDFARFGLFGLVALIIFSDQLGQWTVAFGVVGAGIAFALQEVILSVAGWLAITFNTIFKPGDRILMGGICGDVIDIGLLRTTLMECGGNGVRGDLYNGRLVRITNGSVFKEPVFNYNSDFPFLWDELEVPIRYGSEIELALTIMTESAEKIVGSYAVEAEAAWKHVVQRYLIENARVKPLITLRADENWVTFTIRYVVHYQQRRSTASDLTWEILQRIQQEAGKVDVASAAMDITAFPPVELHGELTNTIERRK